MQKQKHTKKLESQFIEMSWFGRWEKKSTKEATA